MSNVLDTSSSTFAPVPVNSSTSSLPAGPIAVTTVPSAPVGGVKRFATYAADIYSDSFGQAFEFKEQTQACNFAGLFGACYVERIIFTLTALTSCSSGSTPGLFRVGVIPRGSVMDKSKISLAGNYPWMHNFVVGSPLFPSVKIVFARFPASGEEPFPPGLQLDLNATELRFNYATPAVLHTTRANVKAGEEKPLLKWHLEFELRGEGTAFGAPSSS